MNKSVELIKSEIYEVKSNLQKFTDLSKKEPENEAHSFYVTYFTNRLTILQQIKSELETLNILQDKLEFSVIKIDTEEGTKYHLVMKGYNSLISEKEYEAVNKVLEVKDES